MNLPNKLTVLRIILTPVFMLTLVWEFPFHYLVSMLIFIGAALTDLFDGKIARKRGLITDFGKFLDPLADKMLTTAAFLGFIALDIGYGAVWIAFMGLSMSKVSAGKTLWKTLRAAGLDCSEYRRRVNWKNKCVYKLSLSAINAIAGKA